MPRILPLLAFLLSLTLVTGCSNNNSSSSNNKSAGTVTFFHNIDNAGELNLNAVNTSARNSYGTVDFETFSSLIYLDKKTWGLEVVDGNGTVEAYDDTTVLDGVSFTVDPKRTKIIALTGDYPTPSTANLQLHELPVAYDRDYLDSTYDYLQYINISNIDKDLATPVDVYLVNTNDYVGFDISTASPDISNLDFGETSTTLVLDNTDPNYYLIIAEAGTTNELFNSGEKLLKDYLQQTLLISPNHSGVGSSGITVFYYGNGYGKAWQDLTGFEGQLRAYNGVTDSVDMTINANNGTDDYDLDTGSVFGDISSFTTVNAGTSTYSIIATNDANGAATPLLNIYGDVQVAEDWTVIFYGTTSDTRAMRVLENFNASSSRASVTVSDAAYYADPDNEKAFDVYIKKTTTSLSETDPTFSELLPGSYGNERFVGGDYQLFVTEAGTETSVYPFPPLTMTLVNDTNYHFVIIKDPVNGGYMLDQIDP